MTEISFGNHEDVLERKRVLLWASQVHWINENMINLGSLLRILLSKEMLSRTEGGDL